MKTGALWPSCKGDLVERKPREKKRVFYGCNNYPTCNFAIWERPVPDPCPNCGSLMVIPKVGQDPVCYEEIITAQRNVEDKPQQDKGVRSTRSRSKKKPSGDATPEDSSSIASGTPSRAKRSAGKKKPSEEAAAAASGSKAVNGTRSKIKRNGSKKKPSGKAATKSSSSDASGTRSRAKRSESKKKPSEEAAAEPSPNGASAMPNRTTRKKTTIAVLTDAEGESVEGETVQAKSIHKTVNGRASGKTIAGKTKVAAKTAKATTKNR